MSERAHLAVYLIHYRAPEWCISASRSILASEGVDVDLTVIDNGGGGGLPAELGPQVRVLDSGANRGFAGGCNVAISDWQSIRPCSDYIVVGSHDLHVDSKTLRLLLDAADTHPEFGILAPLVEGREHRLPAGRLADVTDVDWASGTCLLIRRSCLDELRGFDETFGSYLEDVELCRRARDLGWATGVVRGSHAHGLGTAHRPERDKSITTNTVLLAYRRGGPRAAARSFLRLSGEAARHGIGAVMPFRPRAARVRSAYMFGIRTRGLLTAARSYGRREWELPHRY